MSNLKAIIERPLEGYSEMALGGETAWMLFRYPRTELFGE